MLSLIVSSRWNYLVQEEHYYSVSYCLLFFPRILLLIEQSPGNHLLRRPWQKIKQLDTSQLRKCESYLWQVDNQCDCIIPAPKREHFSEKRMLNMNLSWLNRNHGESYTVDIVYLNKIGSRLIIFNKTNNSGNNFSPLWVKRRCCHKQLYYSSGECL